MLAYNTLTGPHYVMLSQMSDEVKKMTDYCHGLTNRRTECNCGNNTACRSVDTLDGANTDTSPLHLL
jgi:hypothetical protein